MGFDLGEVPDLFAQARDSIRRTETDPVTGLLMDGSHLTSTQLETLLAESISNERGQRKGERRLFRLSRKRISRGSYNRTLIQAQKNVIHSIYTILLLGYVGLFDTPALQPFLELSDELQGYMEELRSTPHGAERSVDQLRSRLLEVISELVNRRSFKDVL